MEQLKIGLSNYRLRILLGALFAAIAADGVITIFLLQNGLAYEANPFLTYWVERDAFLALKLTGGLLVSLYLALLYTRHPRLSMGVSTSALTMYTAIVYWNLFILI